MKKILYKLHLVDIKCICSQKHQANFHHENIFQLLLLGVLILSLYGGKNSPSSL
ncbi:hypothetical protein LX24_01982 [Desulfallas thermosapovorans DSM 6562]|uniref:Uncharacterized protein n=1 Tax=Desulfallas thermosapovorans DSM 6562 TaxID=1121431 RepID=A0A5S4ZQS2_9FIRM|nr:hypothetical protein LX24_01982 [Desulfallas thermosapovorans DSM 6562]